MIKSIQIGDREIDSTEIITLLAGYQMLPQLCRHLILDEAIADVELATEQKQSAIQQFYQKHQLTSPEQHQAFLELYGMTQEQLETLATSEVK